MTDHADVRAGDQDRDRVAELLRVAVAEGRISIEELNERIDRTYAARTCGELDVIVADLPQPGGLPVAQPYAPGVPEVGTDASRMHTKHGRLKQTGRWVVPARIDVRIGVWGTVTMDFLAAECPHREVVIDVGITSWFGDLHLRVPHGWQVRTDEVVSPGLGRVHNKPAEAPVPDGVVLRLAGRSNGDIWVKYRHRHA